MTAERGRISFPRASDIARYVKNKTGKNVRTSVVIAVLRSPERATILKVLKAKGPLRFKELVRELEEAGEEVRGRESLSRVVSFDVGVLRSTGLVKSHDNTLSLTKVGEALVESLDSAN